jgi:hypothetical protein
MAKAQQRKPASQRSSHRKQRGGESVKIENESGQPAGVAGWQSLSENGGGENGGNSVYRKKAYQR